MLRACPGSGLVDFHCHLDLYPDHAEAVAECERARVFTLAVTTTPKAWLRNNELTSKTTYVRAALGLHPQLAGERLAELSLWEQYLPQARYVGEVGLDAGPQYFRSLDIQKRVFKRILQACARAGGKILSVHSVRASKAVLEMVEDHLPLSRGSVVLHWFTGSQADARRAVDLGCYFSINTAMLANERHRSMVAALPLDRLLTETDGPFTRSAGQPSRPVDVRHAIDLLAGVHDAEPQMLVRAVRANLKRLLSQST